MATGGDDHTLRLWDAGSGQSLSVRELGTPVRTLRFSPDGQFVLSSREDGSVGLYRCEVCGDLRALLRLANTRLHKLHR